MADGFVFHVEEDGDGPVVRLHGELDLATVGPLSDYLLLGPHDQVFTMNFCEVTFMDSTGINLLVTLQHHIRDQGGKLVLYGMRPAQLRALESIGLLDYFDNIIPD
jgi:anti-sigma B factor antagonist